eukprot:35980-Eustigmatos_ZCMA.PRE.1
MKRGFRGTSCRMKQVIAKGGAWSAHSPGKSPRKRSQPSALDLSSEAVGRRGQRERRRMGPIGRVCLCVCGGEKRGRRTRDGIWRRVGSGCLGA